jgi:hypothetical protein
MVIALYVSIVIFVLRLEIPRCRNGGFFFSCVVCVCVCVCVRVCVVGDAEPRVHAVFHGYSLIHWSLFLGERESLFALLVMRRWAQFRFANKR